MFLIHFFFVSEEFLKVIVFVGVGILRPAGGIIVPHLAGLGSHLTPRLLRFLLHSGLCLLTLPLELSLPFAPVVDHQKRVEQDEDQDDQKEEPDPRVTEGLPKLRFQDL